MLNKIKDFVVKERRTVGVIALFLIFVAVADSKLEVTLGLMNVAIMVHLIKE